jgi:hypothetical protein
MYTFLAFCLIVPVSSIFYFVFVLPKADAFSSENVVPMICSDIVFLLISAGLVFVLIKKGRLKRKIYKCLDDCVELYAKTVAISRIYYPIRPATKLRVQFQYKKNKCVLYSGDPSKYYIFKNHGYYKVLEKYVGERVKILYSPKYNEVFFWKSKTDGE